MTLKGKLKSKIGSSSIYDPETEMNIELPGGLKVFNRRNATWIGGTDDGEVMVHVERIQAEDDEVPTILAEGDLDIFLISEGQVEELNDTTKGIRVNGMYSKKPIKGYLSVVKVLGKVAYLVMTATKAIAGNIDLRLLSMDITGRISQKMNK